MRGCRLGAAAGYENRSSESAKRPVKPATSTCCACVGLHSSRTFPPDRAAVLLERVRPSPPCGSTTDRGELREVVAKRFPRRTSKFLQRVRTSGGEGSSATQFGCLAQLALGRLVVPYLAAAVAPMIDVDALHAFRIQGKRVRYAMEIFAGAFDAPFRHELYPVVAALQERLGAINDHVVAQAYLARWHQEAESCRHSPGDGIRHGFRTAGA